MGSRTAGGEVPSGDPIAALVAALGVLLVLDVVVGRIYLGLNLPAIVAGAVVAASIGLLQRRPLLASSVAAATSLWMTYVTADVGSTLGVLGGAEQALPGMAEIAGLALVGGASIRSLPRPHAAAAALAVAAALLGIAARAAEMSYGPLLLLVVLGALAAATGAGLYLRAAEKGRRRALDQARQDERLSLARELHDLVAHHVTGMVVQAQAAQVVWDDRPAAARAAMTQIEAAGAEALGSMRRLVETLRTDEDVDAGDATFEDLHRLAARSATLGLPVRVHLDEQVEDLPPDLASSAHRIVREAITNAQRHATGASGVDVVVGVRGDRLTVRVVDDGQATGGRSRRAGYGITGMAERAEALGGTFHAGPRTSSGWLVEAELPIEVT